MVRWHFRYALIFSTTSPASAAEPKRVLLLHSFGPQFAPFVYIAEQFRDELFRQSPDKIDLFEASLEGARFQQSDEQGPLVDYLDALFRSKKLDLVVTIGAPAAIFAQKYRAQLFPSTPLVIGGPEQRTINNAALTPYDAPVTVVLDFNKWIEDILRLIPDTKHVAWVIGNSPLEKFGAEQFRRASLARHFAFWGSRTDF